MDRLKLKGARGRSESCVKRLEAIEEYTLILNTKNSYWLTSNEIRDQNFKYVSEFNEKLLKAVSI